MKTDKTSEMKCEYDLSNGKRGIFVGSLPAEVENIIEKIAA